MYMTCNDYNPTDSYQIEDTWEFANFEDRWYANTLEGGGEESAPTLRHMIIDAFAIARDARGLDPWTEADRYPELDSWNPSAAHPYAAA